MTRDTQAEFSVQNRVRLLAAQTGLLLMRNNSGVAFNPQGAPVRFGLMNDSAKLNAEIKSSDLIGITPVLIGPEHVGQLFGVFTAIECKRPGWVQQPADKRAEAQAKFHGIVRLHGGYAGFLTDSAQLKEIVRR